LQNIHVGGNLRRWCTSLASLDNRFEEARKRAAKALDAADAAGNSQRKVQPFWSRKSAGARPYPRVATCQLRRVSLNFTTE